MDEDGIGADDVADRREQAVTGAVRQARRPLEQ
jgi:hypothetical protein